MTYNLPKLNYGYDALEPYIDKATMEIHHSKHHQAYTDKMNAILAKYPTLEGEPEELMRKLDALDIGGMDKRALQNNGGGYINHKLFWQVLDPANKKDEKLVKEIEKEFGSLDSFKEKFSTAAKTQFGSGWAWLVKNKAGKLEVYSTSNQDSPLLKGDSPIICLDVWEHAYYLKYQNRRPEYVENFWKVLKLI